jgi:hypothetical protein
VVAAVLVTVPAQPPKIPTWLKAGLARLVLALLRIAARISIVDTVQNQRSFEIIPYQMGSFRSGSVVFVRQRLEPVRG